MIASNISIAQTIAYRKAQPEGSRATTPVAAIRAQVGALTYAAALRSSMPQAAFTFTEETAPSSFTSRLGRWFSLTKETTPTVAAEPDAIIGSVNELSPRQLQESRLKGQHTVGMQTVAPAAARLEALLRMYRQFPAWANLPDIEGLQYERRREETIWSQLDSLACASQAIRDALVAQGVRAEYLEVVNRPTDLSGWECIDRTQPQNQPFTIGYAGALNLENGVPYIIELARILEKDGVQIVLSGECALKLEYIDMPRNVRLTGKLSDTALRKEMARWDAFILPGLVDMGQTHVAEAMASGLPVIATAESGAPVRHRKEGLLCPSHDLSALQAAVQWLKSSTELRRQMGRNARRQIERNATHNSAPAWRRLLQRSEIAQSTAA